MQWQLIPLLAHLAASPGLSDVTLVQNGSALYAIVTQGDQTAAQQLAAQELMAYLNRITGAQFAIKPVRTRDSIILELRSHAEMQPESFTIEMSGHDIVLVGADGPALLCAVYAFLERLGCRWSAPDYGFYRGSHEFVPVHQDLRYDGSEVRESPVLKLRKLYVEEGHSHTAENLKQLVQWMPKLRFNTLVVPTNYQGAGRVKWDNWREALMPKLQSGAGLRSRWAGTATRTSSVLANKTARCLSCTHSGSG